MTRNLTPDPADGAPRRRRGRPATGGAGTPRQADSPVPRPGGASSPSPATPPHGDGTGEGAAGASASAIPPGRSAGPAAATTPAGAAASTPAVPDRTRTWTLAFPAGLELLNANDRGHWARRRRITAALREAGAWLARQQRIPRLGCIRIDAVLEPPDRRRRDAPNWYPSFKAAVDGLVDAGVLPDDSDEYVKGFEMRCGARCPRGRIILHITEVPEPVAARTARTGGS